MRIVESAAKDVSRLDCTGASKQLMMFLCPLGVDESFTTARKRDCCRYADSQSGVTEGSASEAVIQSTDIP